MSKAKAEVDVVADEPTAAVVVENPTPKVVFQEARSPVARALGEMAKIIRQQGPFNDLAVTEAFGRMADQASRRAAEIERAG